MRGRFARVFGIILVLGCLVLLFPNTSRAENSSSNNYQIDESTIGSGGLTNSSSSSYIGSDSTGDLSVGNSTGSNYQIETGSQTTKDPRLSVTINSPSADFEPFSPTTTATATASFSVLNYTSWGYAVQIIGDPPTSSNGHVIPAMTDNDQSRNGIEQFGINLATNTDPTSFGADPDNGQFGFGEVATEYETPNSYRYVEGETIALAQKSSGETKYTISYIVNVTGLTPAGQYTGGQIIIVTGTY
jgi:hypothetical protein